MNANSDSAEERVTAAALIIGDEMLSGRVDDVNLPRLARFLAAHGIDLEEARFLPDRAEAIIDAVRELRRAHTYVFTMGGIGPTHDDITIACVAQALGVPVVENASLVEAVNRHWGGTEVEARRRLTLMPQGAELIGDLRTSAPGFRIENVFILAGLPEVARRSLESLRGRIAGGALTRSRTLRVRSPDESLLAAPLARVVERWPLFDFGSYPFFGEDGFGCDLVIRGKDEAGLQAAVEDLRAEVMASGVDGDHIVAHDDAR